ncbi:hypothetical protein KI387_025933 [Taxus chinensis]|uniref:Rieske domain-containing protein n=1 Tax=Taxus chinensis TaxID=29808 RepID=A0AA38FVJ4_TAXCH|nr:hypothetical protein KI387_025933 [Taxus chinensis]
MADAIVRRGGRIYERSRAFEVQKNQIKTMDGVTITAGAVVMATNSPLNHNMEIHARQTPKRTYVIGLKVPKGSVKSANWWDTYDPYHYVRLEQKPDYDVLIVGGEDTSSGMKPDDYPDTYPQLEKWTRERWTTAEEVLKQLDGLFANSGPLKTRKDQGSDKMGQWVWSKVTADENDHTGDSGQGMTGGTIGVACVLIVIFISANQNQGYRDHIPFVGTDSIDIEDMLPNTGGVIQKHMKKMAVYKDKNGVVHKSSALWRHMKCVIKWNSIDSTFDCPCHGSIFDNLGRIINGPAKADLSPVE